MVGYVNMAGSWDMKEGRLRIAEEEDLDMVALTETQLAVGPVVGWLGWTWFGKPQHGAKGPAGGVGLMVKCTMGVMELGPQNWDDEEHDMERLWIGWPGNHGKIAVGVIYIPPRDAKTTEAIYVHLQEEIRRQWQDGRSSWLVISMPMLGA